MSTLGKVCFWLAFLALIGCGVLGWMLAGYRQEWALAVNTARQGAEAAVAPHAEAQSLAESAISERERVLLGWDRVLGAPEVQPVVSASNGRLIVNFKMDHGLTASQPVGKDGNPLLNADGNPVLAPPVLHAFTMLPSAKNSDGGRTWQYVGEFVVADLNTDLQPQSVTLTPTWPLTRAEVSTWNSGAPWRFRTQVPPVARVSSSALRERMRRQLNLIRATEANLNQHVGPGGILESARTQRSIRQKELLGDPDATVIADRPEYSVGLVQALADEEDARNAVQLEVDQLRRLLQEAEYQRDQLKTEIESIEGQLPGSQPDDQQLTQSGQGITG